MGIDKKKIQPVTVYIPRKIFKEIKRFHVSESRPDMADSAMIVNLLQRWYDERIAQKEKIRLPGEKIGEGLVRLGKMTKVQAEKVLQMQQEKYKFSKRFGEIAVELMYINRATLDKYLGDT